MQHPSVVCYLGFFGCMKNEWAHKDRITCPGGAINGGFVTGMSAYIGVVNDSEFVGGGNDF